MNYAYSERIPRSEQVRNGVGTNSGIDSEQIFPFVRGLMKKKLITQVFYLQFSRLDVFSEPRGIWLARSKVVLEFVDLLERHGKCSIKEPLV